MSDELIGKSTPASRANYEAEQRLSRAVTIPAKPGAVPQRFESDDAMYAAMDAADANHRGRMATVRAAASAVSTPAPTPPAPVARPTPQPTRPDSYLNNIPTIGQPNGAAPAQSTDGNIEYRPATGRGASYDPNTGALIAHTPDPRSEVARAQSHDFSDDGRQIGPEVAQLQANVESAQKRLAANTDPGKRVMFEGQVARAHDTLVHYMGQLESLAKSRSGK